MNTTILVLLLIIGLTAICNAFYVQDLSDGDDGESRDELDYDFLIRKILEQKLEQSYKNRLNEDGPFESHLRSKKLLTGRRYG